MIWVLIIIGVILYIIIKIISYDLKNKVETIKEEYQIQEGDIEYSDLDKPSKPIFSNRLKLVGKPDYIIKQGENYIPVELKKGYYVKPFQSHVIQLIAYCYLVEEKYQIKVPYGVLIYEDYQIRIPYTEEEKQELLNILNLMRTQKEFSRNHNSIAKCNVCG